ncbi:lipid droplet-associated protein [Nocardia blacklockiae]|uniref:lipid droplet-associated protein n=1 Tax=Nocardia blacklockiae TaxID=480036 RepID=UPI0018935BBA|nr:lipid droplet-associated protein [Nocardia blacklockiae]MBF6174412.1 lipid droplet-associated protein [Nocardia blacklockiae]
MFRPPFIARVAAGAAVYAIEETRRLPTAAVNFPITAISQLLQTTMHAQQFVTSLALKGDAVFERLANRPVEQPEWATFDEDHDFEQTFRNLAEAARESAFDRYFEPEPPAAPEPAATPEPAGDADATATSESDAEPTATPEPTDAPEPATTPESTADLSTSGPVDTSEPTPKPADPAEPTVIATPEPAAEPESELAARVSGNGAVEVVEPEVAARYDYTNMTLAQLRARLRMLSVEDLTALLDFEQRTRDRAPFVTMLTNRIATVRAK